MQNSDDEVEILRLRNRDRNDNRDHWQALMLGVALFAAFLAVLGAVLWMNSHSADTRERLISQCTETGGTWVDLNGDNTCLYFEVAP